MGYRTLSLTFLFILVTSNQRTFVSGRLRAEYEGSRDCPEGQTFIQKDKDFAKYMRRGYGPKLHQYEMECGGNQTSHITQGPGGILTKVIIGFLEDVKEPERCTFKIQAPEDHRVYVYSLSYKFHPYNYNCMTDNEKAILADSIKLYDGKVEENSLLYSALHNPHDFNVRSTGRDLLIDIDLSGSNVRAIRSENLDYQRFNFRFAFIKEDNGKVVVYGQTKPL